MTKGEIQSDMMDAIFDAKLRFDGVYIERAVAEVCAKVALDMLPKIRYTYYVEALSRHTNTGPETGHRLAQQETKDFCELAGIEFKPMQHDFEKILGI